MEEENNQVLIDIYELTKIVSRELETVQPLSDTCFIYRAPKRLRDLNEKAYTPQLVSIGPYHHSRKELKPMDEHKRKYLQYFPERSKMNNEEEVDVEELAKCVKKELAMLQPLSDKCSI
ncbi:UPF0481 protein At3g47200 [Jatropha curcas]|uniref:UPF0481 protein At3g47200 n=1 Tax=Jatropha curcas TaxID=180498 RepID=UPI0009D65928|nr:UPF0481 protein At3g47200 [Jatropha curcas]